MNNKKYLKYWAWYSNRVSVFKRGTEWVIVANREEVGPYQQFTDAVWAAHELATPPLEDPWASEYEPAYTAAEHPPISTVRALLQAAWD